MTKTYADAGTLGTDVCNALGLTAASVRRVILDMPSDGVVVAHVELFADNRVFQIDWSRLNGAEVKYADQATK